MARERLQKILAAAGVASRRKSEQLILDGAVRVNGKVVSALPAFADPEVDKVTVGGRPLRFEPRVYYLLNKPKNVVCTNKDPRGRRMAVDLVDSKQRLVCVGRLDVDSTGAIILTNDTQLVNRLTHPRFEVPKTYVVKVRGRAAGQAIEKLKKGVWLAEGRTGRAAVKVLKRGRDQTMLELTITQGLNRQVRRMLAKVGYKVTDLKRTRIGKLNIRGIGPGKYRPLSKSEIAWLRELKRNP